jgi:hypothetical protein
MISIAIFGDSFSSDWSKKSIDYYGWPNMLSETFKVKNFSEPGISEYKILQQIKNHDLKNFNVIIISHTSPTRLHTRKHPIHNKNLFYKNCDLLLSDILYHSKKIKNLFNFSLHTAKKWFFYHYDETYQEEIYNLIRKEIDFLLKNKKVIEIKNFDVLENKDHIVLDYRKLVKYNKNFSNHYDEFTNKKIYNDIKKIIERM